MDRTLYFARVMYPVSYSEDTGCEQNIPVGPCLIESTGKGYMDIVWGSHGQTSVTLPCVKIAAARHEGQIVLLDCRTECYEPTK